MFRQFTGGYDSGMSHKSEVDEQAAARKSLKPVGTALAAGDARRAVQAFLQAARTLTIPRGQSLTKLVNQALGQRGADQLILAFAAFPCPYCKMGFESCELCKGSGRSDTKNQACFTCMGLSGTACNFCGGSGWSTYNFFPADFRPAIADARSRWAIRQSEKTLQELPKSNPSDGAGARRTLAAQMTNLNRALMSLGNAIDLARQLHRQPSRRDFSAKLFVRCQKAQAQVRSRLADTLVSLAAASRRVAEGASDKINAQFENDRASLFERESKRLRTVKRHRPSIPVANA
ncbi:hypothetical protein BH09PLA1_BH09PLA1_02130 [soil metagenome]